MSSSVTNASVSVRRRELERCQVEYFQYFRVTRIVSAAPATARPSQTTKIVESNESQKRTHVSMATTAVGVAARARGGPSAACVGTGSQNDADIKGRIALIDKQCTVTSS
eukprot:COSAG04_NODE_805_length_10154_cov_9.105122_2_plen_110_part_00